jgi:branched-chain amino acid transport system substrate-binding protein
MPQTVVVGLLFSTVGPYAALGQQGLAGARLAVDQINADPAAPIRIEAIFRDPAGVTERYATLAADIFSSGASHIVGCTTSWSRKEVIPVLEKHDAVLWYPCPYEGFECSEQVVYLGACPNQHILPLLQYALPRFGSDGYLVGSNYIWGWETNRIARDIIEQSGGTALAERYVALGDVDIDHVIRDIRAKRPDFVLNTLIGPSSYAFIRAYHALSVEDPDFAMSNRPLLSCNLAEAEAAELGASAAGLFTIAPYFEALDTAANQDFLEQAGGLGYPVSAFFAQAYSAVHLLAAGLAQTGGKDPKSVVAAVSRVATPTPLGALSISPVNNHAILAPHIARVDEQGRLAVLEQRETLISPDPYLAHSELAVRRTGRTAGPGPRSALRVIK